MGDAPAPGSPQDWLRYVRSDLALARTDPRPGLLLESLCDHSQQAVEKSLKAVLVSLRVRPPKTSGVCWIWCARLPFLPLR